MYSWLLLKLSACRNFLIPLIVLTTFSPLFSKDDQLKQELMNRIDSFYGIKEMSPRHHTGFAYQLAIKEIYNQLSPELQKAADAYINFEEPNLQVTIQSPSGMFTLHYDTTNTDTTFNAVPPEDSLGNNIPDYIDSAAVFLDHVWHVEIDELGFMPPLDKNGNPVSTYNVYFLNISDYGATYYIDEINDNRPYNYTSYMEINNLMQGAGIKTPGLNGLRVTCAHEFNHAIQLSYNWWPSDLYFLEMTSTWMEDIVYPQVNDYFFYLNSLFRYIQYYRFTSANGNDPYANCLYLHMLSRLYGNSIVVKIWHQILYEDAIDALETILPQNGITFSQSLNTYAKWLYFTGDRTIPGAFFKDAAFFDMINISQQDILKSNYLVKHNFQVSGQSFYYLEVDSVYNPGGRAEVETNTNNQDVQLNYFNIEKTDGYPKPAGINYPVVLGSVPQDVVFAVSSTRDTTINVSFTFFSDSSIIPAEEKSPVAYGPNPTNIASGVKSASFWAVPANADIFIVDINMRPVRKLTNDAYFDTPVLWDLRDSNGNIVHSGIYFYIVKGQGKTQMNKIAIIR